MIGGEGVRVERREVRKVVWFWKRVRTVRVRFCSGVVVRRDDMYRCVAVHSLVPRRAGPSTASCILGIFG